MKKITILFVALLAVMTTYAQKDIATAAAGTIAPTTEEGEKSWKFGGGAGLFANQVALINWAPGGSSSISGLLSGDIFANYRKGKHSWENEFKGDWGMIKEDKSDLKKSTDVLALNSKYGYQVDKKGKVFVGGVLGFTSQFTEGYKEGETFRSSNFLAPAILTLAAGLDWKPNDMFSLFFSPVAGKMTFVTDKGIDETLYGLDAGTIMRPQFGALLQAKFQKELMKNVKFKTSLGLFTDYLDASQDVIYDENEVIDTKAGFKTGNVDVDWLVGLDLIVNKWITVNLGTQLVYDHDVKINLFNQDGTPTMNGADQATGPRTQFREALNVGLTYRFKEKDLKKVK